MTPRRRAVVVEDAAFARAERQIRAYLYDAPRIDAWFKGSTTNTSAELTAGEVSRLTVQRSGAKVGGASLADGTELAFAVEPARGIAGFPMLTISEEGMVTAAAADGGA